VLRAFPDEKLLLSGTSGGEVKVWDTNTGRSVLTFTADRGDVLADLLHSAIQFPSVGGR
jgi:hypothetical protein